MLSLAYAMPETSASKDAANVSQSFITLRIADDLC